MVEKDLLNGSYVFLESKMFEYEQFCVVTRTLLKTSQRENCLYNEMMAKRIDSMLFLVSRVVRDFRCRN